MTDARMGRELRIATALLAFAAAGDVQAQLYKCTDANGKTVYSDRRCEASDTAGKLAPGVKNRARENEEQAAADKAAAEKAAEDARIQAEALLAAQRKLGGLGSPSGTAPSTSTPTATLTETTGGPYQPSSAERDRLRELELTANSLGASQEQKSAARLEMSSIRSGREARLTSADRDRRSALNSDLSSPDAKQRRKALDETRSLYP